MELKLSDKERVALHSIKKYYLDNYTAIAIDECELLERLVKLFAIPIVIVSVCPNCGFEHTETDCDGYCTAWCLQEANGTIMSCKYGKVNL